MKSSQKFISVNAPTPEELAARKRGDHARTVELLNVTAPTPDELRLAAELKAAELQGEPELDVADPKAEQQKHAKKK